MPSDIFLSYANEDAARAEEIARLFETQGWSVFWDRDIPIGRNWNAVLEAELPRAKAVTTLWSNASRASEWVLNESHYAHTNKKLFPALIERCEIPISFNLVQYADLSTGSEKETTRLLSALEGHLGKPRRMSPTQETPNRPIFARSGESSARILVAYSRHDVALAERVVSALTKSGHSTWWDPDIPVGADFTEVIEGALSAAVAIVALWSARSVESHWVRAEAQYALGRGNLVNVEVAHGAIPPDFSMAPAADLSNWEGSIDHPKFVQLLASIRSVTGAGPVTGEDFNARRRRRLLAAPAAAAFAAGAGGGLVAASYLARARNS